MVSKKRPQARQNSGDNVFEGIPAGKDEAAYFTAILGAHDFSANSRRAFTQDVRKFAAWFSSANRERFLVGRVTTRDVADFRDHLRREQGQAVATINRALVTVRRFFAWLTEQGHVASNPAKKVKELKRVALAPKGLDRSQVRRLLREVELRQDIRAAVILPVALRPVCLVCDRALLEGHAVLRGGPGGLVVSRRGKVGKHRAVRLPPMARRALQAYLHSPPPIQTSR